MNNSMQILQLMLQNGEMKNPQQLIMNLVGKSNPMFNNLMQMANKNNTKGVETFARNICKERGMDFDKEFSNFMQTIKSQSKNG